MIELKTSLVDGKTGKIIPIKVSINTFTKEVVQEVIVEPEVPPEDE